MWKQWHCLNILFYWINTALKLTCMLPNAIIHTMKSLLHGPRMPFRSTVMQGHVANILHLICTILTILAQYFLETCSLDLMPVVSIYRMRRLLSPIGHKPERPALLHSVPISWVRKFCCCLCCWTYLLQVQKNIPIGSRIWILTFYHHEKLKVLLLSLAAKSRMLPSPPFIGDTIPNNTFGQCLQVVLYLWLQRGPEFWS